MYGIGIDGICFLKVPAPTARVPLRTLADGPTTRQKILVVSIWLFSAIFGFLTCVPEKFVHDQEPDRLQSYRKDPVKEAEKDSLELSYCSVKNGVNDMLDYIALVVALVAPLIIGPCIVGVFQVIIFFLLL